MHTVGTMMTATAMILTAACGSAFADCGSQQPAQVGVVSGNPEKDTFGSSCHMGIVDRTGSIATESRAQVMQIGTRTGDAEKDTFGYPQPDGAR